MEDRLSLATTVNFNEFEPFQSNNIDNGNKSYYLEASNRSKIFQLRKKKVS